MEFYFEYEQEKFKSLKEIYSAHGPGGYNGCRLTVPFPSQFVSARHNDFREVLIQAIRHAAEKYSSKRFVISYSGGVDSESIALACLDAGVEFTLRTVVWRSNKYDIDRSCYFAKKFGLSHELYDLDMARYLEKDLYEWVWGAECASEVYFSAEKFLLDQLALDEILLFGIGAPPNVQRRGDGIWVLRNPLVDPISYYQYARYRSRSIWCPYVDDPVTRATWSSHVLIQLQELNADFFDDIWQYGEGRAISEDELRRAKGILYESFPELEFRKKFHGWEKELTKDLYLVANKPQLEAYFADCLVSGQLVDANPSALLTTDIPNNPFYSQSMGHFPWVEFGNSPLDLFCDWDITYLAKP